GDLATVEQELALALPLPIAETEKANVITYRGGDLRLTERLRRVTTDAGHLHERPPGRARLPESRVRRLGGELQHRSIQSVLRITNRELCRVYTNGDPARAGIDVIARQRALTLLVERPARR